MQPLRAYINCDVNQKYHSKEDFLIITDNLTGVRAVFNQPLPITVRAYNRCLSQIALDFSPGRPCTVIMAPYDEALTRVMQTHNVNRGAPQSTHTLETCVAFFSSSNTLLYDFAITDDSTYQQACATYKQYVQQASGKGPEVPVQKIESGLGSRPVKSGLYTKFRTTQSVLDVCIAALTSAIGISAIIMSPVGLPFIVIASMLLVGIIGAFGLSIGRFCVDENSKMKPLHYLSMAFKGGGIAIAAFTLFNACGILALPPALQISLLCVMAIVMIGVAIIDYQPTTLH
jgi:hypothetical protein